MKKVKSNKRSVFFLTTLVLMCCSLFVSVLSACTKKENTPQSGDEVGVYYYDDTAGNKEYLITLADELRFSFIAGSDVRTGSYTLTEDTLVMTSGADWSQTATLKDDVITLTYENVQMRFLRKNYYTITFDTTGGGEFAPEQVLNGKTLAKPTTDPVRDGFIFLGWYADQACTVPYIFGTQPVSKNMTLYARWAQESDSVEYKISYDLGYEGAAELPSAETIGGKLYNPAVPADREGFSFAGWWISDENKADRLTFRYEEPIGSAEGTVFTADTTLFAVWQNDDAACANPAVSVSQQAISWESVDASAYLVSVIAPDETPVYNDQRTTSTTLPVTFDQTGTYCIKVTAINAGGTAISDTVVRYFVNNGLDRVSGITVIEPNALVFRGVENAEKYLISVDCGNDAHNHTSFDNGKSLYFNFSNCDMQPGGMVFTIQAVADGYASSSATFVFERNLAPVSDITAENDLLTWDSVPGANYYRVQIGDESYNVFKPEFSLKTLSAGEYDISVTPVARGFNSPAAATLKYTKTAPALPEDIRLSDMTLSWSEAEEGATYTILVNGKELPVEDEKLSYDLSQLFTWADGEEYSVQLKVVKGDASAISEEFTFLYNALEPTLVYENGVLSWKPVAGALNFEVMLNGQAYATVDNGDHFLKIDSLGCAGVNSLQVRFNSANFTSEWAELSVTAYAITFDDNNGKTETIYKAIGDEIVPPEVTADIGYQFDAWYNTPNGPASNGAVYSDPFFMGTSELVLYAHYEAKDYTIVYSGADGLTTDTVKYGQNFTFEVPEPSSSTSAFGGWFSAPYGAGVAYTDAHGNSLEPWNIAQDNVTVYAFWVESVLSYTLVNNGYIVSQGPRINLVDTVTIPAQHNGVNVTEIASSAFLNCSNLKELNIPDTIQRIPAETAFEGCSGLTDINIYNNGAYQPRYSSQDGVLFDRGDAAAQHALRPAFMPSAKTGSYVIPNGVDMIPRAAFSGSKIEKIVIPASVTSIESEAFANCQNLSSVVFENPGISGSALSIGTRAFMNCTALTSITLPARLSNISLLKYDELRVDTFESVDELMEQAYDAFLGCTNLASINVAASASATYRSEDGVLLSENGRTLAYFPAAKSARSYTFPANIRAIANGAFFGTSLEGSLVIPARITAIGSFAFADTPISELSFEGSDLGGKVSIGSYAFYGCNSLKTLTFAENSKVTEIGESAFRECTYIEEVSFPAALEKLSDKAFYREYDVEDTYYDDRDYISVTFAENGTQTLSIGNAVFYGSIIDELKLPANATISSAFFDGLRVNSLTVAEENKSIASIDHIADGKTVGTALYLKGADGKSNETLLLYIAADDSPENLTFDFNGATDVKSIAAGAFAGNSTIATIVIPAGVTFVGNQAFNGSGLTTVTFTDSGDQLLTIGNYAFANLALESLTLPSREVIIGDHAFFNDESLKALDLGGTTQIGDYAFSYAGDDLAVVISASVQSIGNYAFQGYNYGGKIGSITFAQNSQLKSIGAYAFENSGITEINIPKSVESVGAYAFADSDLETITFEEGTAPLAFGIPYESYTGNVLDGTNVTEIHFPGRLTEIGAYAFDYFDNLTSVTFGDQYAEGNFTKSKLTTIGEYAFRYTGSVNDSGEASGLTSIVIPASITNTDVIGIGAFAFYGNGALTSVTFEQGGTGNLTIGESAFASCNALTEVTLPKTLAPFKAADGSEIPALANGRNVFLPEYSSTSSKLATINVEEGNSLYASKDGMLYSADYSELIFCPPAKSGDVVIDARTKIVADNAFTACAAIKKITFESGSVCAEIGDSAFEGCKMLSKIILPASLKTIGDYAFNLCSSLTALELPESFDSFDAAIFNGCESLTSLSVSDKNSTYYAENNVLYSADRKTLLYYLPSLSNESYVVLEGTETIAASAFSGNTSLTSVSLPASLKHIDSNAFQSCFNLATVTFAQGGSDMLVIGDYAFNNTAIKSIALPGRTGSLGNSSFASSDLTSITFGENSLLNSLGDGVFSRTQLVNVTLPSSVRSLGSNVFSNCSSLVSVTFSEGLTSIGDGTFAYGSAGDDTDDIDSVLKTVNLPASLKTIGEQTFLNCIKLTHVNFAENSQLEVLPATTFYRCYSLISVQIPAGIQEIAGKADPDSPSSEYNIGLFQNLTALKSVTFANGSKVTKIGPSAFENSGLESIVLPSSLVSIGRSAFADTAITEINVPRTVTRMDSYAFSGCKQLVNVELGAGLTSIGDYTFQNCSSLTSVNIPASVTSLSSSAFKGCSKLSGVRLDAGNTSFVQDENGVLFNSSKTEIQFFPSTATTFCVPATMTSDAFLTVLRNGSNLAEVTVENGNPVYQAAFGALYDMDWNLVFVPSAMKTYTIPKQVTLLGVGETETSNYGFFENSSIETIDYEDGRSESLVIMSGYSSIYVFKGMDALTTVRLPANTVIGNYAFSYCSNLETVELAAGTSGSIGQYAFQNTGLTQITIPEGYTSIGANAFKKCTELTSVSLPATLEKLTTTSFADCTALSTLTLAEGNQSFVSENGILYSSDKSVIYFIPSGLTTFEISADMTNSSSLISQLSSIPTLQSITVAPENTSFKASYGALYDSSWNLLVVPKAMTTYTIPKEVTKLEYDELFDGSAITEVTYEEGGTEKLTITGSSYYGVFYGADNLEKVTLPGRTIVDSYALRSIPSLKTVILEEGITELGSSALRGCKNLTTVSLPSTLTTIKQECFDSSTSIARLEIPSSVKTIEKWAFYGWQDEQIIAVPFAEGSMPADYNWNSDWNRYGTIEYAEA